MGLKFLILKWMLILKIVNFEELWKHSSFYVKILKLNQKEMFKMNISFGY